MSKYFKESVIYLSDYKEDLENKTKLSNEEVIKKHKIYQTKKQIVCDKLMHAYNNVLISNDIIKTLCTMFKLNEMYDKTFDEKLIKAYQLVVMYPTLNNVAIKEILDDYSGMLFEEYNLFEELDNVIKSKNDALFDKFITKLIITKMNSEEAWKKEASILDVYRNSYSKTFIDYLKDIIVNEHINASSIILALPPVDLVKKDENIVSNIKKIYGVEKLPFSYKLTVEYANNEDLERYAHTLVYTTLEEMVVAPFTLDEYLEYVRRNGKKNTI